MTETDHSDRVTSWLDRILEALVGPWGRPSPSSLRSEDEAEPQPPSPAIAAARRHIGVKAAMRQAALFGRHTR